MFWSIILMHWEFLITIKNWNILFGIQRLKNIFEKCTKTGISIEALIKFDYGVFKVDNVILTSILSYFHV